MSVLARLNPRERLLVIGGGAALAVLALWTYAWQPLMAERSAQADRIARYLAIADIARQAETGAQPQPVRPAVASEPLAPRVTQSAREAGIALARLDPDGARLRVTVTRTPYIVLMDWIGTLETERNLRLVMVEMARVTEPGAVSARLVLEDAG
ncbi:type II secretion system protein GspM [Pseudaestuariivita sp.]|uniref:type II secretion system protein GspM n=1 Tax=Pseudaestuariivita sp. TaxID=2211669 RepID=UPI004058C4C5